MPIFALIEGNTYSSVSNKDLDWLSRRLSVFLQSNYVSLFLLLVRFRGHANCRNPTESHEMVITELHCIKSTSIRVSALFFCFYLDFQSFEKTEAKKLPPRTYSSDEFLISSRLLKLVPGRSRIKSEIRLSQLGRRGGIKMNVLFVSEMCTEVHLL